VSSIAIATCEGENVDIDSPILLEALQNAGLDAALCIWDDASVNWNSFDLTVLRSTWDYAPRREEFLAWARKVPRLVNPYEVITYSTDKHYLADIAAKGHRIVASEVCDVGAATIFPGGDFVVKPSVGAGSIDAERYSPNDHDIARQHVARLHGAGRDVLIQPYIDSVDEIGERALVYIDGTFSHAMTKGAMLNVTQLDRNALFRREQMETAVGEPEALNVADGVLKDLGFDNLLYARVDLVMTDSGWAVMELELVEPSLFLSFHQPAAERLAQAIKRRISN